MAEATRKFYYEPLAKMLLAVAAKEGIEDGDGVWVEKRAVIG